MRKIAFVLAGLFVVLVAGNPAQAKDKNLDSDNGAEEGAEETRPQLVQENTLEWCSDGEDNDGDGYMDCDDQDCGIYAVCLENTEPKKESPKVVVIYETMGQLKKALRRGEITGREFHRQWGVIRANRAKELAELRVQYKQGKLTRWEYRHTARQIKRKYEGN